VAIRSVCVFCGSNPGVRPIFAEVARELGAALARRGISVVYGGARVGLMGCVADGALAAGGVVIGVLPRFMTRKELAHEGLTELLLVDSMHERKAMMAERAEGFVALPGGYGTMEELFEILTWSQLALHKKPVGLVNVDGFYEPLIAQIDYAVRDGFLRPAHRDLLVVESEVEPLLERLTRHPSAESPSKWTELEKT
jgi:uncharacterized protein (TIGR00730 family)